MKRNILILVLVATLAGAAYSQTTEFTYQGNLSTGTPPTLTTINYDFEFGLYDDPDANEGTLLGTVSRPMVAVANGIFAVKLDFSSPTPCAACFDGSPRWLEIAVRPAGGGSFQTLLPRQAINSTPYSITASNALKLGGTAASQYLLTNGNGSGLTNLNAGSITTGALAVNRGGTGSTTQNFVDLSTDQASIGGNKGFTGNLTVNGNLGIGTNPTTKLEVAGSALIYPSSGNGYLSFRNRTSANATGLILYDDLNTYRGYMEYVGTNGGLGTRNDTVEFGTNGKAMTFRPNETEVMRLTTTGNVGIGTTTPANKLHINGNSGSFGLVFTNSANTLGRRGYRLAFDNDRFTFQKADDNGNFATNHVAIDQETGNVGIGTTDPAAKLDVNGYTKLGGDAPSIRVKKLTGTTAATEGGAVEIAHGLDPSKILSVSVLVTPGSNFWIGPNYTLDIGRHFGWYLVAYPVDPVIVIKNAPGGSEDILSKPIKILIVYEQ